MIHFTADTHFDSPGLIKKMARLGYATMEEHDAALLDQINAHVARRDWLYILGDFAFKRPQHWRRQIKCKNIFFVIGNHDRPRDSQHAFGTVHQIKIAKLACGERAACCHYPMAFWPSSHHAIYHFYGHCHAQREATLDAWMPQRRSMDVGVDNAKRLLGEHRPFRESELMELLSGRTGHDEPSFYDQFRVQV